MKFEIDNRELDGIVVDFDQDEGGTWIGLCLLNDNQLFGRQIPNGLINTTCLDLLDISYIRLVGLNGYVIKDTLDLDIRKIGIGSISPVTTTEELFRNFEFGIERRKLPQTPCDQGITALDPVRECYFEIERIIR